MSEILIPISYEYDSSPELDAIRESAAAKEEQILNLKARLESGVKMWHGIEYPLLPVQIKRREEMLSNLQNSLVEDLDVLTYCVPDGNWFKPSEGYVPLHCEFNEQQVASLIGGVKASDIETQTTPQA